MSDLYFQDKGFTLPYHQQHPEVSTHAHILAKSREMAAFVNARQSIYLDTKFWIKLRDAALNAPQEPTDVALLAASLRAVQKGHTIFPFATDMVMELMCVGDQGRRDATAQLVDQLSLGITLRTEAERAATEFDDFVRRKGREKAVTWNRDLLWTCPAFAFGLTVPHHPKIDAASNNALQKSFVDHLYTLGYLAQNKAMSKSPPRYDSRPLADKMNRLNQQHAASVKSFDQLLHEEFRGVLDFYIPTIATVIKEIAEQHYNRPASPEDEKGAKETAPKFASIIAHCFEKGRIADFVPTLVMRASLAAAVRWDKNRLYHENDFYDFSHAVAALPYFDVFATEKSLAHLTSNDLKLDVRYDTKVVKTSTDLIALLPNA